MIDCPSCHKPLNEAELVIDTTMVQKCNFCGVQFQLVADQEHAGKGKVKARIVSKGLLENSEQGVTFRVARHIQILFIFIIFIVEPVIGYIYREPLSAGVMPPGYLGLIALVCVICGAAAGILAASVSCSEIFTAGGAGLIAGLAIAIFKLLMFGTGEGGVREALRVSLPIFGIYSVGSFFGGFIAVFLRRNFNIKLGK